jgi:hypothetical protein
MALREEYYRGVNRWNRATVARLGLAMVGLLSTSLAMGQIHGAPPSVTSKGFGGRAINGPRPSVTSLGPHGYTRGFNPAFPNSRPSFGTGSGFSHRPHPHPRFPVGTLGYYGAPYYGWGGYYDNGYYDNGADAQNYAPEDPGYVPRPPEPSLQAEASSAPPQAAPEDSTPTVLVFKDGHQLEVENYAIVGTTLYDLTEGHRRKVALADLDLTATAKQNDDRGIDFHLPAGSVVN